MKKLWIYTLLITIYILAYSVAYYLLCNFHSDLHFRKKNTNDSKKISFIDCLYLSVLAQSTSGHGTIEPNSDITEILVGMQAFSTILFVIYMNQ